MSLSFDFSGKYVFVTGSTIGIGKAIAELLVKSGAKVAIHGRTKDKVDKVVKELNESKKGGKAVGVVGDLAKNETDSIVSQVEKHGDLDILVNNAGVYDMGGLDSLTVDVFQRQLQVNVISLYALTRHFLPKMLQRKEKDGKGSKDGRIINISSVVSQDGAAPAVQYGATKAAVDNMTLHFATMTSGTRVTVNSVFVGPVDTEGFQSMPEPLIKGFEATAIDRTTLKRLVKPEEIAKVVAFLASDDAVLVNGALQRADSLFMKHL